MCVCVLACAGLTGKVVGSVILLRTRRQTKTSIDIGQSPDSPYNNHSLFSRCNGASDWVDLGNTNVDWIRWFPRDTALMERHPVTCTHFGWVFTHSGFNPKLRLSGLFPECKQSHFYMYFCLIFVYLLICSVCLILIIMKVVRNTHDSLHAFLPLSCITVSFKAER